MDIKNIKIKIKDFVQSKKFVKILCGIGVIVVALIIFQAGIFVGYHKAAFSYKWGENYYHDFFGGPREERGLFKGPMGMMGIPREDFSSAHGVSGKIIKVDLPTIVIDGQDNVEKVVLIKDDTVIRSLRENIKPTDLKADDFVVVIGSPDDKGQIEAKLIRIIPSPPPPGSVAPSNMPFPAPTQ